MVSTDICWDLHFSRSNPRQPAARESIEKPTGAAPSPHTREGSRFLCPNTHRAQRTGPAPSEHSGSAPTPGGSAAPRTLPTGEAELQQSPCPDTEPGGEQGAAGADPARAAAQPAGSGQHVEPDSAVQPPAAGQDGTGGLRCTPTVLAPHAPRWRGEPTEGQRRRPPPHLAAPGAQRPVGKGRSAAPNRAPNPRRAEGSRWRRRNFHRGRPRRAPGPVNPVQEEESPKQTTQTLPNRRTASYLPRSRRLLTARVCFAPLLVGRSRSAQVALAARFPRAARPRRPAHPPPGAAERRAAGQGTALHASRYTHPRRRTCTARNAAP